MSKRRTNAFFLSDGEVEQERLRLQQMVKGIARTNQSDNQSSPNNSGGVKKQATPIEIGVEFWSSDKGAIVKAIVLNRAYNKEAILRVTQLKDEEYREAATELFQAGLLLPYEKVSGNLGVASELYCQCKQFFKQPK